MRALMIAAASLAVYASAFCAPARAGTVTRTSSAITYQAGAATAAAEAVAVGVEAGMMFVTSDRGAATTDCMQTAPERADCQPAPAIVVNLLGFNDRLTADALGAVATIEAHGGGGDDRLNGALAGDRLFGDAGRDNLDGRAGGDALDGGADDDAIIGGPGQDQIAGGDGSDTIEARDGEVDTIDCGAGSDTALADVGDLTTTNCEAGVDFDGDGVGGNADCAPTNPAIGPRAAEVAGNAIDENCDGVVAPLPDLAIFTSSPKVLRVSPTGRFTYAFAATPGRAGKIRLTSTRSIKVGSKQRKLKLAAKSFTAPASGKVKLRFKLSATNLKALKRVTSLQFAVRVTVGSRTFATKLRLKPPKKR